MLSDRDDMTYSFMATHEWEARRERRPVPSLDMEIRVTHASILELDQTLPRGEFRWLLNWVIILDDIRLLDIRKHSGFRCEWNQGEVGGHLRSSLA